MIFSCANGRQAVSRGTAAPSVRVGLGRAGATLSAELVVVFCSILDANQQGDVAGPGFAGNIWIGSCNRCVSNI